MVYLRGCPAARVRPKLLPIFSPPAAAYGYAIGHTLGYIPMRLSRRHFLGQTLSSGVVAGVGHSALAASTDADAPQPDVVPPATQETLSRLFETFVPTDDSGPGAHESGALTEYLQMLAASTPGRRNWIILGCRWLDIQAKSLGAPTFAQPDEDGRAGRGRAHRGSFGDYVGCKYGIKGMLLGTQFLGARDRR